MSKITIDPKLVVILGQIVDQLPRSKDEQGKEYRGIGPFEVASAFYAVLRQAGHPLANVISRTAMERMKNPGDSKSNGKECSFEKPCNECRQCVLSEHSKAAQAQGLIVVRPPRRAKPTQDSKGRWTTPKTFARYYRKGEMQGGTNFEDFASKLLSA